MNRLVKVVLGIVLAVVIVWLLFTIVFPWVDRTLITDPTLEAQPSRIVAVAP